jgi:hypothetical protein
MNTISYLEAQRNFTTVLQKATKEDVLIDGIDGNKFILAIYKKTSPSEKKQKLSERFAGCLSNERVDELEKELKNMRTEWERDIY